MAWEWSHTQEGYDNVRENIGNLSKDDRRVILAEIATYRYCKEMEQVKAKYLHEPARESCSSMNYFDKEFYKEYLSSHHLDILVDTHEEWIEEIWKFASEYRTCDNGGWEAYICPHGCHKVSFSAPEDEDGEDLDPYGFAETAQSNS